MSERFKAFNQCKVDSGYNLDCCHYACSVVNIYMKLIRDILLVILLFMLGMFITIKLDDPETEDVEAFYQD